MTTGTALRSLRCVAASRPLQGRTYPNPAGLAVAKGACAPFTPSPTLPRVFHAEAKAISRSGGRSAAGVCAYVACTTARDVFTGDEFDYRPKTGRVGDPLFVGTSHTSAASFAEALDGAETRGNSCVAREVIVALPDSLTDEARRHLVVQIAEAITGEWDLPVMAAVHRPSTDGDKRNHHAHLILGTRDCAGKKVRAWNGADGRATVDQLRAMVSAQIQASVSEAERPAWSHLSHAARGIEAMPMKHEGNFATRLKRRWGVDLAHVKINAQVRTLQAELAKAEAEVAAAEAEIQATTRELHEHTIRCAERALADSRRVIDRRELTTESPMRRLLRRITRVRDRWRDDRNPDQRAQAMDRPTQHPKAGAAPSKQSPSPASGTDQHPAMAGTVCGRPMPVRRPGGGDAGSSPAPTPRSPASTGSTPSVMDIIERARQSAARAKDRSAELRARMERLQSEARRSMGRPDEVLPKTIPAETQEESPPLPQQTESPPRRKMRP